MACDKQCGKIDENGTASRKEPGHTYYSGPADPAIDAAWEQLIGRKTINNV